MSGVQCPHCGYYDTRLSTTDPSGNREAAGCLVMLGGTGILVAVVMGMADPNPGAALLVGVISLVAIIIAIPWIRRRPSHPLAKDVWMCENCGRMWDYQP